MNLITGGAGFIGIHIARQLIASGQKVRILDIVSPNNDELNSNNIEYVQADIRQRDKVIEACRGIKHIYHLVSLLPISKAGRRFIDVNVGGTRNILDGALKYGVKKIVHMSSSAVYDVNQANPMNEESRIKPVGKYGNSKYEGEKVCFEYQRRGVDITIVRPRTAVGPERLGIYGILFDWIRRGKHIYIIGDGKNKIQFIHVRELADACIRMANTKGADVFNIGTERFATLKEDLESLIAYAGTKSKVVGIPASLLVNTLKFLDFLRLSPLADWHYLTYHKDFYFDITKAKGKLGWMPNFSNSEMLIETYQWYLNHRPEAEARVGTTHRKSVKQKLLGWIRNLS